MTVYVDSMRAPFRGMIMCHMIADTLPELLGMASKIGVAHKHLQRGDALHFDICLSKRAQAVKAGAIEITHLQASAMCLRRRVTGFLGDPGDAIAWARGYARANSAGELTGASNRNTMHTQT